MSRLTAVHIPFVGGMSESVDPKILPDGVFSQVQNMRLPQGGALQIRKGWRPLDMSELSAGATLDVFDLYSHGESLIAACRDTSTIPYKLATFTESNANTPWILYPDAGLSPVTRVQTVGNLPTMSGFVHRASAAITSDGVYGAVLVQTDTECIFRMFNTNTDETIFMEAMSDPTFVRKIVGCGDHFTLVESTGVVLQVSTISPTFFPMAFNPPVTIVTANVTGFDACTNPHAEPTHIHIVYQVTTALTYQKYTISDESVSGTKTVDGTVAATIPMSIASDDSSVHVVYLEAGDTTLLSFSATTPFTTSTGPTAIFTSGTIQKLSIAMGTTPNLFVLSDRSGNPALQTINRTTHAEIKVSGFDSYFVTSAILGRESTAGFGYTRGGTGLRTNGYVSHDQHWFHNNFGTADVIEVNPLDLLYPALNPSGDALVMLLQADVANSLQVSVKKLKFMVSERRQGLSVGASLYITGGTLAQWTGGVSENGMLDPIINATTPSNSTGTIVAGDYLYLATLEWADERQRGHHSIMSSLPFPVTVTAPEDTVSVEIHVPKTLRRNPNIVSNPIVTLFRTEVGPGELFYKVGSTTALTTNDVVTIVDTQPDSAIIDEQRPYTEGEFGAVSGVLDICPPFANQFIAATRRRVVLGSSDQIYQISQTTLPNEPACFAQVGVSGPIAFAYLDEVRERITGVANIDDVMIIGTATKLYAQGGAGPNLAGIGEFEAPAMLSSDVGFFNAFSILDTAEGLWFQGSAGEMYLLPQGSGTPIPDDSMQTTLAATTIVGCGYNSSDNVAAWALANGKVLVRDLVSKQWFQDTLPLTTPLKAFVGHRGSFYAVDANGDVWEQDGTLFGDGASGASGVSPAPFVRTGAIQAFGLAGTGRVPVIELVGQFQTEATITLAVSYDDGLAFNTLSATHVVTGLSVNQTFRRQWYPPNQRGGRFMLQFQMTPTVSTTEGCRLAGCTVYLAKPGGPSRLPSAQRK